jgi:hypothetical protein
LPRPPGPRPPRRESPPTRITSGFHEAHRHLASPFGTGGFGEKAELFARFFGTPKFLLGQTALVAVWIAVNSAGLVHFDIYPFILLNLAFSLQAAYAAPLILLAQTRQADRDKALAEADAKHREDLPAPAWNARDEAVRQNVQIQTLLEQHGADRAGAASPRRSKADARSMGRSATG